MKVIVAGSRDIDDYCIVLWAMQESHFIFNQVISGGARGVDRVAVAVAKAEGIPVKLLLAEWDRFGKRAGYYRNIEMAVEADALVAIWDGKSRGTKHMIDIATDMGLQVFVVIVGAD